MKILFFKKISTQEYKKANKDWESIAISLIGHACYIQCGKNGAHRDLSRVKRIWHPVEIVNRFNEGKPTVVFNK